jgi:hypothetical protein
MGDPCAGLPLNRCECLAGDRTTCGARYASVGACAGRVLDCQAGVWPPGTECTMQGPELCDPGAIDDDCDGSVDEGCNCINAARQSCGISQTGVRVCAGGAWGSCTCEAALQLDIDQSGAPDVSETALTNGSFTVDISGWLQSQRDNRFDS